MELYYQKFTVYSKHRAPPPCITKGHKGKPQSTLNSLHFTVNCNGSINGRETWINGRRERETKKEKCEQTPVMQVARTFFRDSIHWVPDIPCFQALTGLNYRNSYLEGKTWCLGERFSKQMHLWSGNAAQSLWRRSKFLLASFSCYKDQKHSIMRQSTFPNYNNNHPYHTLASGGWHLAKSKEIHDGLGGRRKSVSSLRIFGSVTNRDEGASSSVSTWFLLVVK